MKTLLDFNLQELESLVVSLGEQKFRAKQLQQVLLDGKFEYESNNLPKSLLEKLANNGYIFQPLRILKKVVSKDKTVKYLYKLEDGNIIEGVLMTYKYGKTLCVSTQVGCKMNCAFCASGLSYVRDLSCGEILGQVVAVNKMLGGTLKDRKITNIVLMGSGEPLDNFDAVVKFLQEITSSQGMNFSVRNISLSTCGIPQKIVKLADLGLSITLCLSLHASNDVVRSQIMPIARRYTIKELLKALQYYYDATNRRIIIEYVLIDGVNTHVEQARELAMLLQNLPCHVNLIRLNPVPERGLKPANETVSKTFLSMLVRNGISATIRRTTGDDVTGACGQLRISEMKKGE